VTVDYVDWVETVWQGIAPWWEQAEETDKTFGFQVEQIGAQLQLPANLHSPDPAIHDPALAILTVFWDLRRLGLLENTIDAASPWYKPAASVEAQLGAPLSGLWTQLRDLRFPKDREAFLAATVRLSQDVRPTHVLLRDLTGAEVFDDLGWPWDPSRADNVVRGLASARPAVIELTSAAMGAEFEFYPTYIGCAHVTRGPDLEWAPRIEKWVEDWETTNVEFKRDVVLKSPRQRAEFVKDILALANTKTSGQRFLIIGFDPKTFAPIS
jgi:hypothetical protein